MQVNTLRDSQEQSMEILKHLLGTQKRRLNIEQEMAVAHRIAVEPTALYVRLIAEVASKWASWSVVDDVPGGVQNLVEFIFDGVAKQFGEVLTKTAFGFLTFSLEGVSDSEMCDLLSLSDEVLEEVTQYNSARRVPSHVWIRLRREIDNLITEQSGGCLKWYHRQLKETAEKWVGERWKRSCHVMMGHYFGDIVDEAVAKARDISRQPLVLNSKVWASVLFEDAVVNVRRCQEAGHHLLLAEEAVKAERELCSLAGVCARAKSGLVFQLLKELGQLQQVHKESERVVHYCRWIMRDAHSLSRSPASVGSCSTQPLISIVRQDLGHLKKLVKPCVIGSPKSWSCGNVLGGLSDFGADLNVLQGHSDAVNGVSFSPNSAVLASCSSDKTIRLWDSFTGEKKKFG